MPVEWILHLVVPDQDVAVFIIGFLAIIPLAKLLAFGTDELSLRVGQTWAGLINATLGNVVELMVAIIALSKCELAIVQSSLIGSILSNLLLVLGMCFFFGGTKFREQYFAPGAAEINSSLLAFAAIALVLPSLYQMGQNTDGPVSTDDLAATQSKMLKFSHGMAIILFIVYGCYIRFQITHGHLFSSTGIPKSTQYSHETDDKPPSADGIEMQNLSRAQTEEEVEVSKLDLWICIGLLVAVTGLVYYTADNLVDSISGLTASGIISKEFVGIILLPIIGNAAEHVSAVTGAVKDKLTLSIGVAVGSGIQIGLGVIPVTVLVGWIMNKPLTMFFDPYEASCLFLAVLMVNYCTQDNKSNWLEGTILICLYLIFATAFYFYSGTPTAEHFAVCT
ncbi:calcium/proton exchanger [Mycena maculata]|uniref:Vacuolar calcium ion transporter n=1 Tax=Mycena maculata TaxID=230809 RepID=A0AAD7IXN9_9AGAR|nr:calcium/proton exchanger [Mycena maculata]